MSTALYEQDGRIAHVALDHPEVLNASMVILRAEDARIGHMPAHVGGCPTTAMWLYRLGSEKAKRMLFTGEMIDRREAEKLGMGFKAVPAQELDRAVDGLAQRIGSVPQNQLMLQKPMLNGTLTNMGLQSTRRRRGREAGGGGA